MWEETLIFPLCMPEIALIRFLVWDHDPIGRDFIGQRTISFTSMMPGEMGSGGVQGKAALQCFCLFGAAVPPFQLGYSGVGMVLEWTQLEGILRAVHQFFPG